MKTIILVALILACSMAVSVKRPMTNAQISKFESLKKENTWASIMMNLAELHVATSGPLDTLIEAIENVIDDIDRKIERSHQEYDTKTFEHNEEVDRIGNLIDNENEDIANTTELLNNILYVQRTNLTLDIANLEKSIANGYIYIDEQTTLRASSHASYQLVVVEHEEALSAVQEALEILETLNEEGTSLLQVKKAKNTLMKVQEKIAKNVEGSFVKALLALTSSEQFANQEGLRKVTQLLTDVAFNLRASVEKFNEEEEQDQVNFVEDIRNKNSEIAQQTMDLSQRNDQLVQTIESIADNEDFLAQRQRDLVQSEADLVEENENFDRVTELYEDLVAQLTHEQSACGQALDILNNSDFPGYIGSRMESDVIIDQPHGTDIRVERTTVA